MDDRLTCILCPIGCELEVTRVGDKPLDRDSARASAAEEDPWAVPGAPAAVEVKGNECDKGLAFAADEVLHPKRNLATSVPALGTAARMVSVRLTAGVPREMIFPILAEIGKLRPALPVRRGQVLIANVLGTGVDVIATRTIEPRAEGVPGAGA
jgi:CxxC motif-containing protein